MSAAHEQAGRVRSNASASMLFNSLPFLYFFLPITYAVFGRLRTRQQRYVWLTLTGYVFDGFWNYRFCAIMAASTLVSYLAVGLQRWREGPARRTCLVVPIAIDLALLGFLQVRRRRWHISLSTVLREYL